MSPDEVVYLEPGQRWVSLDAREEIQIRGVRGHRWVAQHPGGTEREWAAAELRSRFRPAVDA